MDPPTTPLSTQCLYTHDPLLSLSLSSLYVARLLKQAGEGEVESNKTTAKIIFDQMMRSSRVVDEIHPDVDEI